MAIEVHVPESMRDATGGAAVVHADGGTVAALLDDLGTGYPALTGRLLDDSGLRRLVNLYVGSTDVRFADGLRTALADGDVVTILPAWATAAG